MAASRNIFEKAFNIVKNSPRVSINNLRPNPGAHTNSKRKGRTLKHSSVGKPGKRGALPRIGHEGGQTPFYLLVPKEPYYNNHNIRRQYPPMSLLQLQRLIDKGFLNPDEPIDLTSLCNVHAVNIDPFRLKHYGVQLTDEGADIFQARVHIEVQWTTELTIAAIERAGGVVTTSFYDPISLTALVNPEAFFKTGSPIPRRMLPPVDCVEYYTDARNRGYLSDPGKVAASRAELSQRYGYALPDLTQDPRYEMLTTDKDPRQVFRGLEPGWIVNMADKVVLKPTDDKWQHYYRS